MPEADVDGIVTLLNGSMIPPLQGRHALHGAVGVFDADGAFCAQANIYRNFGFLLRPEPLRSMPDEVLPGRHLYGGQINHHFGHFLCESIARLWPLREGGKGFDSILFLSRRAGAQTDLQRFQTEIFDLLGVRIPVRVITQPMRVESLTIPEQGFGTAKLCAGTPRFRAYVRDQFARDVKPDGPERLFISRAGLSVRKGAMIGEDVLGRCLEREGYEVFLPERADIPTQIARYKAARWIVGSEGSALHLFGLVGRSDQRVALIARRSNLKASRCIVAQLDSFCGRAPVLIDAIRREWDTVPGPVRSSKSIVELGVARLHEKLRADGFALSRTWRFKQPDGQRRVERISRRTGRDYRLVSQAEDPQD